MPVCPNCTLDLTQFNKDRQSYTCARCNMEIGEEELYRRYYRCIKQIKSQEVK